MTEHTAKDDRVLEYLNGLMDDDAVAAFEDEMASSPALAAEVTALRAATASFKEADLDAAKRTEAGWARLEREIAPHQSTPQVANDNRPLRIGLAQAAGLAVAAVALWQFLAVPQFSGASDDGFIPVSAQSDAAVLQVMFQADADMANVINALSAVDGVIIDGPSAIGLFRVGFDDAGSRDAALAALLANSSVVQEAMPE